jgi:hypothetical protein
MDKPERPATHDATHYEPSGMELETDHENHPERAQKHAEQPNKTKGHPQRLWQRFRAGTIHNQLTVIFTALIFIATGVYAILSGGQLYVMRHQLTEIKNSSADTHDLAIAAGKQADAAKTQSDQAVAQTDKMGKSLEKTDSLIRATADLAAQAKRSANLSATNLQASQDAIHLDERPWIGIAGVTTDGGTETQDAFRVESVSIAFHNSGKTPAVRMKLECCMFSSILWRLPIPDYDETVKENERSKQALRDSEIKQHPELAKIFREQDALIASENKNFIHEGGILAPGVFYTAGVISKTQWQRPTEAGQHLTLYVMGKLTYYDIFPGTKQHSTKFCLMHTGGTSFSVCPASNWMD